MTRALFIAALLLAAPAAAGPLEPGTMQTHSAFVAAVKAAGYTSFGSRYTADPSTRCEVWWTSSTTIPTFVFACASAVQNAAGTWGIYAASPTRVNGESDLAIPLGVK